MEVAPVPVRGFVADGTRRRAARSTASPPRAAGAAALFAALTHAGAVAAQPLLPFAPPVTSDEPVAPAAPPPGGTEGATDATKERVASAVALHDEARELYARGAYREAIEKLEAAVALDPDAAELVYNLGLLHEKLLEFDAAERYFARYIELEKDEKLRERAQTTLRRIQGAKKELAERPPPPPPPPPAPKPRPVAKARRAAPSPPVPSPAEPWIYATGGVAAASMLAGVAFGLGALAQDPGEGARTGAGVSVHDLQADARTAHQHAVVADVCFVVAAIAGGAALWLLLAPRVPRAAQPASPSRAAGSARSHASRPSLPVAPIARAHRSPAPGAVVVRF